VEIGSASKKLTLAQNRVLERGKIFHSNPGGGKEVATTSQKSPGLERFLETKKKTDGQPRSRSEEPKAETSISVEAARGGRSSLKVHHLGRDEKSRKGFLAGGRGLERQP